MEPLITVEHLLQDPDFRAWVLSPNPGNASYWQQWQIEYPMQQPLLKEARDLLLSLRPRENQLRPTGVEQRVWERIHTRTYSGIPAAQRSVAAFSRWKVAASILICLLGAALIYGWRSPTFITHTTAYGEIQDLSLPDGSLVVLSANSSLRYPADWQSGADREVWLDGEAFFKVEKRLGDNKHSGANYAKFTVRTAKLAVEVLGTEFSVRHRQAATSVVLTEGQVRVSGIEDQEEVLLEPGEMLTYSADALELSRVDARAKNSWKESLLIFKDKPLSYLIERLEDTYGYRIKVSSPEILEHRFSGSCPRDSVGVLLEKIEKLYQLNITHHENQIDISR